MRLKFTCSLRDRKYMFKVIQGQDKNKEHSHFTLSIRVIIKHLLKFCVSWYLINGENLCIDSNSTDCLLMAYFVLEFREAMNFRFFDLNVAIQIMCGGTIEAWRRVPPQNLTLWGKLWTVSPHFFATLIKIFRRIMQVKYSLLFSLNRTVIWLFFTHFHCLHT